MLNLMRYIKVLPKGILFHLQSNRCPCDLPRKPFYHIIFQKLTTFLSTFVCTEAKLEKLQGKSGKRKPAKDMLQSLSDARECQMQGFLHDTNPYSSSNLGEDDDDVSIFFNHRI